MANKDRKKHDGSLPDDEDWADLGPVTFANPSNDLPAIVTNLAKQDPNVYGPVILEILQRIALADPGEYMSWGPRGVVLKDSDELTPEQRMLVAEVSEDKDGVVKLKLCSKDAALKLLGQASGVLRPSDDDRTSLGTLAELVDVLRSIDGRSRGLPPKIIDQDAKKNV